MKPSKPTPTRRRRWEPPETILPWTLDGPDPDRDLWHGWDEFSVGATCPCCGEVVTVRDTPRWPLTIAEP